MSDEQTKICSACRTEKPVSEYYRSAARPGGLDSLCKTCRALYNTRTASRRNTLVEIRRRNAAIVDRYLVESFESVVEKLWKIEDAGMRLRSSKAVLQHAIKRTAEGHKIKNRIFDYERGTVAIENGHVKITLKRDAEAVQPEDLN